MPGGGRGSTGAPLYQRRQTTPVSQVSKRPYTGTASTNVPIWGGSNAVAPANQARIGVSSPGALSSSPAYNYITNNGRNQAGAGINNAALQAAAQGFAMAGRGANPNTRAPNLAPAGPGGGSSGGGGGGGGGGAPGIDQAMLDWLAGLLGRGGPAAQQATTVDLPDFTGTFDPSVFNQKRTALTEAVGSDTATAQQATQRIIDYLGQNYQNAYTNPNNTYATAGQAPGMNQQAMGRLLAGQGVDPSVMAAEAAARAGADQAFGNVWRSSAANEDTAQRNRLNTATLSGEDARRRIAEMGQAGTAGLNIGEATARSAFDQQAQERNWETAQQEALANWQRANTVTDTNTQNQNAYRNQVLQALLGVFPNLAGTGLALPGPETLGF
jgi:hypothetical protein